MHSGRGIEKICSTCKKDGVPQLVYTINPGDIMIKLTAPEDRIICLEKMNDMATNDERTFLSFFIFFYNRSKRLT